MNWTNLNSFAAAIKSMNCDRIRSNFPHRTWKRISNENVIICGQRNWLFQLDFSTDSMVAFGANSIDVFFFFVRIILSKWRIIFTGTFCAARNKNANLFCDFLQHFLSFYSTVNHQNFLHFTFNWHTVTLERIRVSHRKTPQQNFMRSF